jgi:hypothetical protein
MIIESPLRLLDGQMILEHLIGFIIFISISKSNLEVKKDFFSLMATAPI